MDFTRGEICRIKKVVRDAELEHVLDLGNCVITQYYTAEGSVPIGCTGKELTPNRSCASHNIPVGTKIYIEDLKGVINDDGIFTVEDTGGHGFDFDIFTSNENIGKIGNIYSNVKVIKWGTGKITSSYTHIIEYFIKQNRINKYKKIWSNYKDKGRLINFFDFNEEDKNIKDKPWYNNI